MASAAADFARRARAASASQPRDFDLRPQHVRLRRGAAGISGVRCADDVTRKCHLLGDQRRGPPPFLQHQERVRRLNAHIERRAIRLGAQAIDICQGGGAAVPANAGERNLLLDRDADVGAAQHERQVVERRRNHRIGERRHDGRARLTRANPRARRLDFVPAFARDADDIS